MADASFAQRLQEKILVFDGATGTTFQFMNLTADDFGGEALSAERTVDEILAGIEPMEDAFVARGGVFARGRNKIRPKPAQYFEPT